MKTFRCLCGNPVYFRNTRCLHCERSLGFSPELGKILVLESESESSLWKEADNEQKHQQRRCKNHTDEDICNWLVHEQDESAYCRACRLNEMIPDLSQPNHRQYWYRIECAKRHLFYTLFRLGLPVDANPATNHNGLSFAFVEDRASTDESKEDELGEGPALTGHANGRITLNIKEADHVARTHTREQMNERYRTLLGHFRHETGHYYWDRLVRNSQYLAPFRQLFGDETQDYAKSLEQHYEQGPPDNWRDSYISAYASMHPWEDWAETWAHYMHMTDTLETAADYDFIPETLQFAQPFEETLQQWEHLTLGLNATSRSMGLQDSYPFVITPYTRDKMALVHDVISRFTPDST